MAVKIRLVRLGRRNRAFFRLRVSDRSSAPTSRFIEELGFLDPLAKDPDKQVRLKKDRIEHWLSCGAEVSPTVSNLLKKNGIARQKGAPATK